jgi:hypothetical protein
VKLRRAYAQQRQAWRDLPLRRNPRYFSMKATWDWNWINFAMAVSFRLKELSGLATGPLHYTRAGSLPCALQYVLSPLVNCKAKFGPGKLFSYPISV